MNTETISLVSFIIAYTGLGYSIGGRTFQKMRADGWEGFEAGMVSFVAGLTWPAMLVCYWAGENIRLHLLKTECYACEKRVLPTDGKNLGHADFHRFRCNDCEAKLKSAEDVSGITAAIKYVGLKISHFDEKKGTIHRAFDSEYTFATIHVGDHFVCLAAKDKNKIYTKTDAGTGKVADRTVLENIESVYIYSVGGAVFKITDVPFFEGREFINFHYVDPNSNPGPLLVKFADIQNGDLFIMPGFRNDRKIPTLMKKFERSMDGFNCREWEAAGRCSSLAPNQIVIKVHINKPDTLTFADLKVDEYFICPKNNNLMQKIEPTKENGGGNVGFHATNTVAHMEPQSVVIRVTGVKQLDWRTNKMQSSYDIRGFAEFWVMPPNIGFYTRSLDPVNGSLNIKSYKYKPLREGVSISPGSAPSEEPEIITRHFNQQESDKFCKELASNGAHILFYDPNPPHIIQPANADAGEYVCAKKSNGTYFMLYNAQPYHRKGSQSEIIFDNFSEAEAYAKVIEMRNDPANPKITAEFPWANNTKRS